MILSFRNRDLRRYWERNDPRGLNPQHVPKLKRILFLLSQAAQLEDMNVQGFRLHKLSGESPERWAVVVNKNWRVTFSFEDGDAFDVDYEDYH